MSALHSSHPADTDCTLTSGVLTASTCGSPETSPINMWCSETVIFSIFTAFLIQVSFIQKTTNPQQESSLSWVCLLLFLRKALNSASLLWFNQVFQRGWEVTIRPQLLVNRVPNYTHSFRNFVLYFNSIVPWLMFHFLVDKVEQKIKYSACSLVSHVHVSCKAQNAKAAESVSYSILEPGLYSEFHSL